MVLGPSGCGKTTMLNLIGGLDKPTGGEISFNGKSFNEFTDADYDNYRNKSVGFIFQNYYLIPHLTVLGNVEIALAIAGLKKIERREQAKAALKKVGLSDKLYQKPNKLSGGQAQRVAIARALVNYPEIVLADEPTGALDSVTGGQIMELLKEIAKGRLVIMVTHNQELADKYGTRIVKMLDGRVVGDAGVPQITNYKLQITNAGAAAPLKKESGEIKFRNPDINNIYIKLKSANIISNDVEYADSVNINADGFVEIRNKKLTVDSCQLSEEKLQTANCKLKTSKNSKMNFLTALLLSLKNLLTKKVRTSLTSAASAFGITGVALVIALGSGMTAYVKHVERNTLAAYPLTVSTTYYYRDYNQAEYEYPFGDVIIPYDISQDPQRSHENNLDEDYETYLNGMNSEWVNSLRFSKSYSMRLMVKTFDDKYKSAGSIGWNELGDSKDFVLSQYEALAGSYPSDIYDVALVIDKYNRVSVSMLNALGIDYTYGENLTFSALLGSEIAVIPNDAYYLRRESGDTVYYGSNGYNKEVFEAGRPLRVTAVLRPRQKAAAAHLSAGIKYLPELQQSYYEEALESEAVRFQIENPDINVFNGTAINDATTYTNNINALGAAYQISYIYIYANGYEGREKIKEYLNAYNDGKEEDYKVYFDDSTTAVIEELNEFFYAVIFSLAAFAGISLLVSSVMISIIIYISVVERTKEIGLLRSLGARKTDVFRVFSAEAVIIGLIAGIVGIITAYAFTPLVDYLGYQFLGIKGLTQLSALWAAAMVGLSCLLTFIAGMVPGVIAARKNPVTALRSE